MRVVHLTASGFFGGPERQILGLTDRLAPSLPTKLLLFAERGSSKGCERAFRERGHEVATLRHDSPHFFAAVREIASHLTRNDRLLCHGYKACLLGRLAARLARVPAIAVSRGWTSENWKVRAYTIADKMHLKLMDHVIAVSDGQARKCRRAGVARRNLTVIRNGARLEAFAAGPDDGARQELLRPFSGYRPSRVVVAAGRFSPEKGFDVLIESAAVALRNDASAGLVIYGEGSLRPALEAQVRRHNLGHRVKLPGFASRLDALLASADVVALTSHSEGLPNVLLEASSAAVSVVATRVGGVPEVVDDGVTGLLARAGDHRGVAEHLTRLLNDSPLRHQMGRAGRAKMHAEFTFEAQAERYRRLLADFPAARVAA